MDQLDSYHSEITPEPAPPEEKKGGFWRFFLDVLETLLLSAVLFAGINFISARIRVEGFSMLPTMQDGEYVIVNKLAYKLGEPSKGDVIVFHFPRDPEQEYIKRVIGLPGDQVVISNRKVAVNGVELTEDYIAASPAYEGNWVVPEDSLFVLGDNRNNSSDSHSWGPVSLGEVIGKAVFVYWPPARWGIIDHPILASAAP